MGSRLSSAYEGGMGWRGIDGPEMTAGEIDRRCATLARLRELGLSMREIAEALDPDDVSGVGRSLPQSPLGANRASNGL